MSAFSSWALPLGVVVCLVAGCTSTGTAGVAASPGDAATEAGPLGGGDACAEGDCEDEEDAGPGADAALEAGGSRSGCARDADCTAGDEPFCDVERGRCIECQQDADCSDAENPRCAPAGECTKACTADAQCDGGDEGRCALDLQLCVECVEDSDCTEGTGTCDTQRLQCLECVEDSDCGVGEPYCVQGGCYECEAGEGGC